MRHELHELTRIREGRREGYLRTATEPRAKMESHPRRSQTAATGPCGRVPDFAGVQFWNGVIMVVEASGFMDLFL